MLQLIVYVSADHKGMIAFSKTLCKFYAQPVCFFRGNLTRAEGLAHMIGDHIICAAHPSGSGNVLPLCQKELRIRSPAVTRIAGNELTVVNARIFTMPETGSASGTVLKVLSLLTALGCLGLLLARKRRP